MIFHPPRSKLAIILTISSNFFYVSLTIASILTSHSSSPTTLHVVALKLTSLGSIFDGLARNRDTVGKTSSYPDNDRNPSGRVVDSSSSSHLYGVDRSFPIHHLAPAFYDAASDATSDPFDGASKRDFYEEFMEGCRNRYAPEGFLCDDTEVERIEMNLRQPSSMYVSANDAFILP